MTTSKVDNDPILLRQKEAEQLLASVSDPIVRQLMAMAYAEVKRRFEDRQDLPESDFDAFFFMEGVRAFFNKTDMLERILAGEDLAAEFE